MAMTDQQKAQLIVQIWTSELDYAEIKARADVLALISPRTPEQEFEYQSYLTKLAHDKVVIAQWAKTLKQNGVNSIKTAANLVARLGILDNLKLEEQAIINRLDAEWQAYVISYGMKPPEERNQVEFDNSFNDYQTSRAIRVTRLNLLENLKVDTVWTDIA